MLCSAEPMRMIRNIILMNCSREFLLQYRKSYIICVLFTEEIGGIFTIEFDENGNVELRTEYAPEDYLYDDIGSGLLISEVRRKRQELFESLSLYYKAVVLHEDMSELLDEEGL